MNYENGIFGFFNEHRYLSNYHLLDIPITLFGYDYVTTEAAYQAAKSNDKEIHQQFSFIVDPKEAKRAGQLIEIREDWPLVKDFCMYEVNRQKYSKNRILLEKLLGTGDRYLEETNWWGDNYWGYCISGTRTEVLKQLPHPPGTVGLNKLGHTLMTLRTALGRHARRHIHQPIDEIKIS